MPYPREYIWDETNTPSYVYIIRLDEENSAYNVTFTLVSATEIHVKTTNVNGLSIDFEKAITGIGLTATEIIAAINILRMTAPTVKLVLEPHESSVLLHYRFVFPSGITIREIYDSRGNKVTFVHDVANNAFIISYYFHSIETLNLIMNSLLNTLSSSISTVVMYNLLIMAVRAVLKYMKEYVR